MKAVWDYSYAMFIIPLAQNREFGDSSSR